MEVTKNSVPSSESRKSVVKIILPTNNNKSENSTNKENKKFNELIDEKKRKINYLIRRIFKKRSRRGSNISAIRKQTTREKIQPRYLTLEPLCCLSSCLVRTGCHFIAFLELFYVLIVGIAITLRLYDSGHLNFWSKLNSEDFNYNKIVMHQTILYTFSLFATVTLIMAFLLIYGLFTFERIYLKIHWHFDIISLILNSIFFIMYTISLTIEWTVNNWKLADLLLIIAFVLQIPIQIWAITVVKGCYDFYVLLHVFITLAEK